LQFIEQDISIRQRAKMLVEFMFLVRLYKSRPKPFLEPSSSGQ